MRHCGHCTSLYVTPVTVPTTTLQIGCLFWRCMVFVADMLAPFCRSLSFSKDGSQKILMRAVVQIPCWCLQEFQAALGAEIAFPWSIATGEDIR